MSVAVSPVQPLDHESQDPTRHAEPTLDPGPTALGVPDPAIDVSIVIVNWNTQDLLRACLVSIEDSVWSTKVETIVVDNGSTDGSIEAVERDFPDVRLLLNERNRGFAAANNQGLSRASGRYLLLLNSDTVVRPGALEEMVAYMDTHPWVGGLGPRLINRDGTTQHSTYPLPRLDHDAAMIFEVKQWPIVGKLLWRMRQKSAAQTGEQTREVDSLLGACILLRRKALDQVGLLDDGYFFFFEEHDLFWRLREKGWRTVFLASAEVVHLGGATWSKVSAPRLVWYYRGVLRFYRLHASRPRYLALRALHILGACAHITAFLARRRRDERPLLSAYGKILANALKG